MKSKQKSNSYLILLLVIMFGFMTIYSFNLTNNIIETVSIVKVDCVPEYMGFLKCSDINMRSSYDSSYVEKINLLIETLPNNEILATNNNRPQIEFFTGHKVFTFWGINDKEGIVNYMKHRNSKYLLITESTTTNYDLREYFRQDFEDKLSPEFELVNSTKSELKTIHLLRLIE